jgi:hypothetical protein
VTPHRLQYEDLRPALTAKEVQVLNNMAAGKSLVVSGIRRTLGIGRTTFCRHVKAGGRVVKGFRTSPKRRPKGFTQGS